MGFSGDFKPRREELGFDFAKDGAMGKRKPCPGSKWRWDLEQLFPAYCLCSAVEQHSPDGCLSPGWFDFDEVHFCFSLEMARADDPLWIIGPLACVGVDVRLDSDSLEGAKSLTHALDFALVQTLIPDGLTKQAGDGADAR